MSSRVLSAYFDDFRKGKREREELRRFMEHAIRQEPLRRGHFMGWLDQAQYEHPIPVTEFLLLRKEIEATLDNDDETRIVTPQAPVKIAPDADTLVAGDEEATIMAAPTEDPDATEISSGSQPSDMARLHDIATPTLVAEPITDDAPGDDTPDDAHEDATLISSERAITTSVAPARAAQATQLHQAPPAAPARPARAPQAERARKPSSLTAPPTWAYGVGALLLVSAGLGYWATRPMATVVEVQAIEAVEVSSPVAFSQPAPGSITPAESTPLSAPASEPISTPTEPAAEPSAAEPAVDLATLSKADAIALLKERADQGLFLPRTAPDNAEAVLNNLSQRFPGDAEVREARVYLKDAYLAASKKAQGRGEWDQSQALLDAAFEVLSASIE